MTMDDGNRETLIGKVVLPGDRVLPIPDSGYIRVGPGLHQQGDFLLSSKPGLVKETSTGKVWMQGIQKRFIPAVDDLVIGVITERHGESFNVDIRAPFLAVLPMLSFEGATRRNRPNLQPGDVVYARVEVAHRDMDPTLTCVDAGGKANGLGHLKGGYIFTCNTYLSRRLLARPPCAVLESLGSALKFELAVGMNGQVWVDSERPELTILVSNAILDSELKSDGAVKVSVSKLLKLHRTAC
mmetsp:Transcript_23667/g.65640  ORF Transcript_23667/g.65640 Transcript_23667/m.65640 type:complete len:241 (+) Transcript_23667:223-945(+)